MRTMLTVGDDEITDRFGGHFDGWSDEDVIRAYLVHHLRRQEDANQMQQLEYMTPMRPMFTSSSQLEGYRSMGGSGSLLTVRDSFKVEKCHNDISIDVKLDYKTNLILLGWCQVPYGFV